VRNGTTAGRLATLGCIAAAVAVVAYVSLLPSAPSYRATAEVILVPNPAATQLTTSGTPLDPTRAVTVATALYAEPRWVAGAAEAASVPPDALTFAETPVEGTPMIQLSAVASTAGAAEVALTALIANARPVVESLSGPYTVVVVASPDGTGMERSMVPAIQVVAAVAGLLAVLLGVWLIRRRRARRWPPATHRHWKLDRTAR
jgi:hypothetical protein